MGDRSRQIALKALETQIEEMEKLGFHKGDQWDWEDDVNDPIEKAMVTKDEVQYSNRGRGYFKRPQKRGKNFYRGKKFDNRSWNGKCSDYDDESDYSSSSSSFYSCRTGYSRPRIRRSKSLRTSASTCDSDMSFLTSVSRMNNSFKEYVPPSNLAKHLSEYEDFQATLLQLMEGLEIDHKSIRKVALDNDRTFEVKGELILLRPKVTVCTFHLGKGCDQQEECNNIHICYDFIIGHCKDRECCFGHYWCTNHNKRVFNYYHLNHLNIKTISSLLQLYLLPFKNERKDLQVCQKYNEDKCENTDCPHLHLCLKHLAGQCSTNKCSLNHKVSRPDVSSLLQAYGISVNETPRDIILSIVKVPSIQKNIEKLKIYQSGNESSSENKSEKLNKTDTKDKDTSSSSSADKNEKAVDKKSENKVEKVVPIKTMWSHELMGDVTIDEICYNSVEDYCSYEEKGCWRLHCPFHFHWQIKAMLGKKQCWVNLTVDHSLALEKAFCDPAVSKVNLPILEPSTSHSFDKGLHLILKGKSKWEADFDTMTLNLVGKNTTLELRRLCTEITNNETPDPCKFKWYFSDISKNWIEYGNIDSTGNVDLKCALSSKDIENHRQTRPNSPLPFQNNSYTYILDVQNMVQMNLDTNARRTVRRRPISHLKEETDDETKSDLSSTWEPMQQEERCRRVTLQATSDEYKKIQNLVHTQAGGNTYNIVKIERVQNPWIYRAFQNKVQEMNVTYKNDTTIDVRQLFHGTSADIVPKICDENFDWRLHGSSSGQLYGRGTYFATLSSISYGYTRPDASGHRFMFVAKVAVGTITAGNSGMARPPINAQYNLPYDSTVDNVGNPTIIVKYDKQEYYPEYIITFG